MDLLGFDDVIVVKDQDQIVGEFGDLVQQADDRGVSTAQLGGGDDLLGLVAHILLDGLDGGDEVGPKAGGIVVPLVQGQPCGVAMVLGKRACYQARLAESCRSGDQGEPAVQALVQTHLQAGTANPVAANLRCVELGSQKGERLRCYARRAHGPPFP